MDDKSPGTGLPEEPQEERGAPGSRDEGTPMSDGGTADRPAGDPHSDDQTGVDKEGTAQGDMDPMPAP